MLLLGCHHVELVGLLLCQDGIHLSDVHIRRLVHSRAVPIASIEPTLHLKVQARHSWVLGGTINPSELPIGSVGLALSINRCHAVAAASLLIGHWCVSLLQRLIVRHKGLLHHVSLIQNGFLSLLKLYYCYLLRAQEVVMEHLGLFSLYCHALHVSWLSSR